MSKVFKIQPAAFVDHVTEDGVELTKLPYPFFADEQGMVGRQDFWNGDPYQVIGFADELEVHEINLSWGEAVKNPSLAVGMYLVTSDAAGNWGTHEHEIAECELIKSGDGA